MCQVAVQDAGMSFEIPERQVVIVGFIALEASEDLAVAEHVEAVALMACSQISTLFGPDGKMLSRCLVDGRLQLRGGLCPRGAVAGAIG